MCLDFGAGFAHVANFVEQALAVAFALDGWLANVYVGWLAVVGDCDDFAGVSGVGVAVVVSGAGCDAGFVEAKVAGAFGVDCACGAGFTWAGWRCTDEFGAGGGAFENATFGCAAVVVGNALIEWFGRADVDGVSGRDFGRCADKRAVSGAVGGAIDGTCAWRCALCVQAQIAGALGVIGAGVAELAGACGCQADGSRYCHVVIERADFRGRAVGVGRAIGGRRALAVSAAGVENAEFFADAIGVRSACGCRFIDVFGDVVLDVVSDVSVVFGVTVVILDVVGSVGVVSVGVVRQ